MSRIRCNNSKKRLHRRGFTLVEFLATTVVLGVIGVVASGLIYTSVDGYVQASTQAQLHNEMSVGLDRIVRELRSISVEDIDTGSPDIDRMSATGITWHGNRSLVHRGNQLVLTTEDGTDHVLMSQVEKFIIEPFDEDNNSISTPLDDAECDDVRRLQITVVCSESGVSEMLRTRFFLRATMARQEF